MEKRRQAPATPKKSHASSTTPKKSAKPTTPTSAPNRFIKKSGTPRKCSTRPKPDSPGEVPPETKSIATELQVVGVNNGGNGRSCPRHGVCGKAIAVGDLLIVKGVPDPTEVNDVALGVFKFEDGAPTCQVGFLPRKMITEKRGYIGCRAVVTKVSSTMTKAERSKARLQWGCLIAEIVHHV